MSVIDPVSLITTVGFPIGAFLLVYMDLRKQINKLDESVSKLCQCLNQQQNRLKDT
jgi:hypothetical protein